jgi:GNAT superfamily N-acetyltransferase
VVVRRVPEPAPDHVVAGLARVLVDCVDGGASVGFMAGFGQADAKAWFRQLLADPEVITWYSTADASTDAAVDGTVSLRLSPYPNSPHRAEVSKLLVARDARRLGRARELMAALEDEAKALGRTLLMLDTESGSGAEQLYRGEGWVEYGRLEDHAAAPDGPLKATTFYAKTLAPRRS